MVDRVVFSKMVGSETLVHHRPAIEGRARPKKRFPLVPRSKIGGRPIGLSDKIWPRCTLCGRHMDFLAQVDLRLRPAIAAEERFAFVFVCPGYLDRHNGQVCSTWDATSGANCLLLAKPQFWSNRFFADFGVNRVPVSYSERHLQFADPTTVKETVFLDLVRAALKRSPNAEKIKVSVPKYWGPSSVVWMRDETYWVQRDETPLCAVCGERMTLLFELLSRVKCGVGDDHQYFLPIGDQGYAFACKSGCGKDRGAFMWQVS